LAGDRGPGRHLALVELAREVLLLLEVEAAERRFTWPPASPQSSSVGLSGAVAGHLRFRYGEKICVMTTITRPTISVRMITVRSICRGVEPTLKTSRSIASVTRYPPGDVSATAVGT
jgi:hypothetical protein